MWPYGQEKTSRTAEVLAAVTPSELMTGKVIGIGLVGVGRGGPRLSWMVALRPALRAIAANRLKVVRCR
jgi:ABC-type Na+ efflux pump permease subunit